MSILGVTPKRAPLMEHKLHRAVEWPMIIYDTEAGDTLAAVSSRYNVDAADILTALSCAGYPLGQKYGQHTYPWHEQFAEDVRRGASNAELEAKYPVHPSNYKMRHKLAIVRGPRISKSQSPPVVAPKVEPPRVISAPPPPPAPTPPAAPAMNSVQTGMIPVYNQFGNIVGVMQTASPFTPAVSPTVAPQPNVPPSTPPSAPPQSEDDIILQSLDEAIRPVLNSLRIILRHSGPAARQTLLTILKQANARFTASITGVDRNSWTQAYFTLGAHPDSLVIIAVHMLLTNED